MLPKRWPLLVALFPLMLPAQERGDFQQILQRLDQLERENRNLADEVHALRSEIAGARLPPAAPAIPQTGAAAFREGHRQRDEEEGQTFTKKVGQGVLPTFLSV